MKRRKWRSSSTERPRKEGDRQRMQQESPIWTILTTFRRVAHHGTFVRTIHDSCLFGSQGKLRSTNEHSHIQRQQILHGQWHQEHHEYPCSRAVAVPLFRENKCCTTCSFLTPAFVYKCLQPLCRPSGVSVYFPIRSDELRPTGTGRIMTLGVHLPLFRPRPR